MGKRGGERGRETLRYGVRQRMKEGGEREREAGRVNKDRGRVRWGHTKRVIEGTRGRGNMSVTLVYAILFHILKKG